MQLKRNGNTAHPLTERPLVLRNVHYQKKKKKVGQIVTSSLSNMIRGDFV